MTMRHSVFVALLALGAVGASTAAAQTPSEVKPPVVIHHVDAVYPPSALAERKDTDVVLAVTVDADGHVSKVDVVESGGADVDEAAIVAARQWTFVPATRNGKPVASRIKMPFHFAPPAPAPELVETPKGPGDVPVHEAVPGAPPPAAPAAPSTAEPQEVLVAGRSRPPSRGPSDFEIPVGELRVVPRTNAADYLKLAPGLLVTNEGGEGHADSIILRGFDAGEGEAMELTVGGVPINDPGNFHGNGYADTHFIIPEAVASLRVLEGPFDPRQGNFAVAGSGEYELGMAQRGLTAKQTVGSYGTARTLVAWGPEDQDSHTFAAAEYAQSNGFGENRAFQRGSALAQYEGKLGDRGLWRLTGQAYSVVAQSAGVIREDDYEAGRIGFYDTYNPNQGQDSSRYSIAADLETRYRDTTFTQQLFLIDRSVRIREDFTGFVVPDGTLDAPPVTCSIPASGSLAQSTLAPSVLAAVANTPVCQDPRGTMLDLAMTAQSLGVRGSARTRAELLGQPQELEIGYFARGDVVNNVQNLIDRATQVPYATNASLSGVLGDFAIYGDANLKPLSWVTVRGGVREELFTYDVEDHCPTATPTCDESPQPSGNTRTSLANSALLPRASVLLGAFEGFTLVGSYGRGVRSLAIDEVMAEPTPELAAITSYEGGISYARTTPVGVLSLSSVFYGTQISRDEIFDPTAGRTVETGATTRSGWTGAGRFTGRFFDELANVGAVRGIVNGTDEPIPYVPHVMARSDTALFGDLPWPIDHHPVRASFGPAITFVGARSLPYGQSSDAYFLFDAALKFDWRAFHLSLIGTNLLDTKYRLSEFTFVSNFATPNVLLPVPERAFTAGAPRMLFLSLAVTLGG